MSLLITEVAGEEGELYFHFLRADRIVTRTRKFDRMTPVLKKKFHWLPVRHCIVYKILSLVYKAINEALPCYISDKLNYRTSKRTLTSLLNTFWRPRKRD